jgi:hypothetical protein
MLDHDEYAAPTELRLRGVFDYKDSAPTVLSEVADRGE